MPIQLAVCLQIQTIVFVSDLPESVNESGNSLIIPLLESSQIGNLHIMNARELDNGVMSHLFFQRKPSANLYACQDQVSCI
jgi:hypothetical protein